MFEIDNIGLEKEIKVELQPELFKKIAHNKGFKKYTRPDSVRLAALAKGENRYIGKECKYGHGRERYVHGSNCVTCTNMRKGCNSKPTKRNNKDFGEAQKSAEFGNTTYTSIKICKRGHSLRYVISNGCVECSKISIKNHVVAQKYNKIKRTYGLTKEQYHFLFANQNECCKVCNFKFKNIFESHVDHNHKTGKVRGLLCRKCNTGIGLFNEERHLFEKAILYLQENN